MMLIFVLLALVSAAPDVDIETLVDVTDTFPVAETLCTIAEERRLATLAQLVITEAARGALDMMIDDLTNSELQFLSQRGFMVVDGSAIVRKTVHSLCSIKKQGDVAKNAFIIDWSGPCNDDDYDSDVVDDSARGIDTVK